ncbi:MAG TPA: DUF4142 domain-containing protein [Geminicoccaceae bacterium]
MHRRDLLVSLVSATAALALTRTAIAQVTPGGAMPTGAYLNMATKGGLFLENTARDANGKTENPALRKFTRAEIVEQVNLANKMDAYTGRIGPGAGAPPGPGGVVGGLVMAPLAVAGATVGAVGGVLGMPGGARMTSDEQKAAMLSQLAGLQPGPQYDATFVNASLMGHQEALQIHGTYAETGEDPGLRRIAQGSLPLIRQHIATLSRMQAMMGQGQG